MNVQDVVFQNVFMHPTFPEIDERNIDRITPVREKTLTLDLSLFRGTLSFLKIQTDKTGTPANLITFWFVILLFLQASFLNSMDLSAL